MTVNQFVAESREVGKFERVILRVYNVANKVQITQGEHESLTIKARPEILSKITTAVTGGELVIRMDESLMDKLSFALSTSLTRPTVRYHLTVRNLAYLDLVGLVHADASVLRTTNLSLKLKGAGEITIGSLTAHNLAVDLQGAGRIELSGQVGEQRVAVQGSALYQAPSLQSQRARVRLKGIARASVWAVEKLDVRVRGLGRVEVRGTPQITQDISPRAPLPRFGHL
jgi:hypothetical protein